MMSFWLIRHLGARNGPEIKQNFTIATGETAFLFLQHFIKSLKVGGRGAIVIKNTFLSNADNASRALRQELTSTCNLHTVLDCPPKTFLGAGVKTVVLFFEKVDPRLRSDATRLRLDATRPLSDATQLLSDVAQRDSDITRRNSDGSEKSGDLSEVEGRYATQKIWFYQLDPGRSLGKTNLLNDENLKEFVEFQADFRESGKSWFLELKDVDPESFDLSVKNPNAPEDDPLREPEEILAEIADLDQESAEILAAIGEMLA